MRRSRLNCSARHTAQSLAAESTREPEAAILQEGVSTAGGRPFRARNGEGQARLNKRWCTAVLRDRVVAVAGRHETFTPQSRSVRSVLLTGRPDRSRLAVCGVKLQYRVQAEPTSGQPLPLSHAARRALCRELATRGASPLLLSTVLCSTVSSSARAAPLQTLCAVRGSERVALPWFRGHSRPSCQMG